MTGRAVQSAQAPLRIALVAPLVSPISEPLRGGSQAVVADLAQGLVAGGHDVTLYAALGSHLEGVAITSLGIDAATHAADTYRHDGPTAAPSRALVDAYRVLYAHVREQRFDVVHNHGFDVPAIGEAVRARVPVVHTLHLPPTGAMVGAVRAARWSGVATRTYGVSASHTASWRRMCVMDGTLANGVAVDRIPWSCTAPRRALLAMRFSPEKGMAEGIGAARRAGWPVIVHGIPYDAAYEAEVRARWGHDPAVDIRPAVDRASLWRALSAAGCVLCPAQWDEPFGMVAAEAQAAGTPVVATRRGGLPEVVRDGETGYLVEPGDADAAVAALGVVATLHRRACRRHAQDHLSLRTSLARHQGAYAQWVAAARVQR